MAGAPLRVAQLEFVDRIPQKNMKRNDTEWFYVLSLCSSSDDVVVLACDYLGLRTISLNNSQLSTRTNGVVAFRDVCRMAFDAHTDTLLLLVSGSIPDYLDLVSLRRNASDWIEVQCLQNVMNNEGSYPFIEVCDSASSKEMTHCTYIKWV